MATQKKHFVSFDYEHCNKCGGKMANRLLATNDSEVKKFTKIRQCVICKHWFSLEGHI
ncbi:MAG: hypothetical protein JW891_16410 [Candidatus Lokiarchaeota archaeon]|nr:hypothetical protein [Candidatus Lokiarchaeota archaeon]